MVALEDKGAVLEDNMEEVALDNNMVEEALEAMDTMAAVDIMAAVVEASDNMGVEDTMEEDLVDREDLVDKEDTMAVDMVTSDEY